MTSPPPALPRLSSDHDSVIDYLLSDVSTVAFSMCSNPVGPDVNQRAAMIVGKAHHSSLNKAFHCLNTKTSSQLYNITLFMLNMLLNEATKPWQQPLLYV